MPPDARRTVTLITAQGRVRSSLVARLVALIVGMLTAYRRGPQSAEANARLVSQLAGAFEQGEKLGVGLGRSGALAILPDARRQPVGAPQPLTPRERIEAEVEQIVADWMAAPSPGVVEAAVAEHVSAAQRSGTADSGVQGVTGWRRVIHPELAEGGTCGLCVAAATRTYGSSKLRPLHDGCNCDVMPIVGDHDPGEALNRLDMGDLYDDAGQTTDGWTLKQTRYQVGADGNLVAVRTRAKQGPRESQAQIQRRARQARKAKRAAAAHP